MIIEIYGEALRLLDHFVHYANGEWSDGLATAMFYNKDAFRQRSRLLEKAFLKAMYENSQRETGSAHGISPVSRNSGII